MREQIESAIECWASRPTWFSSHPSDVKELRQAISNLKSLPFSPNEEDLSEIIYYRVVNLPSLPGTPKDIQRGAMEFASKIVAKL